MKESFYATPPAGFLMRLLWKAAGADRSLLEKSTYSDQVKYMCMGGIVLATGVMAAIAGGYAFYTIFEPKGDAMKDYVQEIYGKSSGLVEVTHTPTAIKAFFFGIIWGMIIFNIDRFIVSSSGKGDGTEAITWGEFKSAIPRILMGMIIALTISKPIEIRMFKSEIDVRLHQAQMEEQKKCIEKIELQYAERIKAENKKIDDWQKQIDAKETAFTNAEKEFNGELAQKGTGGGTGYGEDARHKEVLMNDRRKDRDDFRKQAQPLIDVSRNKITEYEKQKEADIKGSALIASGLDGLLERIKLSDEIAGFWISLFITLLFMAIELTPIFFKLMLIQGPYDYMSDNVKELIRARHGIEVQYNYYKDKKGQEKNHVIFHQPDILMHEKVKWSNVQKELSDRAIDKWHEKQKQKMDENLEEFIKED